MRISQLAERSGVPASTLRFYESAGLLPAERTPAGYRHYGQDAVERLEFIGAAKHLGLSLEEIAELLAVWESGFCAEVKAQLRPRIGARIAGAEQRAAELAAFTALLRRALAHLDALPDRGGRCDPQCAFLDTDTDTDTDADAARDTDADSAGDAAGSERWRTAPLACSLTEAGVTERAAQWRRLLDGAGTEAIAEGVRLVLPAGRAGEVAALAVDEQGCCPFFDFRLHLDGPVLYLEVRAPADGAELLAELFTPAA
ncbi:MerR family transcriptional regulator [Crossiella sp. CA-258035]|uniref:MerR family transcriptional regulator n=1 Tax=Crossiella sp. CA-258035 TaxID=2981138 RepID=UPI0024BC0247|nr:MerR family transcriptional regulator [Crossiella sp. CA-258035]WHT23604.1 MerR family transcriptional regulator [Crossiella sp. CA-258035]